ncbi:hypothetical protein [Terrilactibacillus tamarindi]|nr:hypothetical protein [Terrilactibacillus tamarindi]
MANRLGFVSRTCEASANEESRWKGDATPIEEPFAPTTLPRTEGA